MKRKYLHTNELTEMAETIATHITIRSCANHNSHDETFETTPEEWMTIRGIALAALHTINSYDGSVRAIDQAIVNGAEYQAIFAFENKFDDEDTHVNTYDTIYCPLMNAIREWPREV